MPDDYLTVTALCRALAPRFGGLVPARSTIYRWMGKGLKPAEKDHVTGRLYFVLKQVILWRFGPPPVIPTGSI